jgi:multidrug transporter EmrE-like cation transporter
MAWLLLVVAVLSNVTSNVMFRYAMQSFPETRDFGALVRFAFSPYLLAGFAACGTLLICYLLALRHIGLMLSYVFVISMSLVGISLASVFVLNEGMSAKAFVGVALIVAGLVLVVSSPARA